MLTYDRIKSAVTALVRQLTAKYDYAVTYSAVVQSQNSDGTVNVKPDSESLQYLPQVPNVKVVYDSPGTKVDLNPGATGYLFFANRSPASPRFFGFDGSDAAYSKIELGKNGRKIARQGDVVMSGGKTAMVAFFTAAGTPVFLSPSPGTVAPGPYLVRFGSLLNPPDPTNPLNPLSSGRLVGFVTTGATKAMAK